MTSKHTDKNYFQFSKQKEFLDFIERSQNKIYYIIHDKKPTGNPEFEIDSL